MGFLGPHVVVQWGGRLGINEIWSNRLRIALYGDALITPFPNLPLAADWAADNLTDIATDVTEWFADVRSAHNQYATLEFVKVNAVGSNGLQDPGRNTNEWVPTGTAPTGTAAPWPFQVTMAVTLDTEQVRGLASRGRMFVPTGNLGVNNDGRVNDTTTNDLAEAAAEFISNLNNQPGVDTQDPRVVIASKGNTSVANGPMREVTSVRVGNVPDTQRRRRNQLQELYSPPAPVV